MRACRLRCVHALRDRHSHHLHTHRTTVACVADTATPQSQTPCQYGVWWHAAGIIGALNNEIGVLGVLPGVSIVGLKVLNSQGSGTTSEMIAALTWLLADSPDGGVTRNPGNISNAAALKIAVINMSLGLLVRSLEDSVPRTICSLLGQLEAAGIVSVAAASKFH